MFTFFLFLTLFLKADDKSTFPGEKPYGNTSHALYGGKIHISPEETLKVGTILIRNGLIEKTGELLEIPPGYREWNCSGKTIYAGFIDPYIPFGPDTPNLLDLGFDEMIHATSSLAFKGLPSTTNDFGDKGPGFETSGVTPEKKLVLGFQGEEKILKAFEPPVLLLLILLQIKEYLEELVHASSLKTKIQMN